MRGTTTAVAPDQARRLMEAGFVVDTPIHRVEYTIPKDLIKYGFLSGDFEFDIHVECRGWVPVIVVKQITMLWDDDDRVRHYLVEGETFWTDSLRPWRGRWIQTEGQSHGLLQITEKAATGFPDADTCPAGLLITDEVPRRRH